MKFHRYTKSIALAAAMLLPLSVSAADTIKVGVLHSLSGTMAINETTLKDTALMMIEEQNKKGGLLGKKLEAVVVDPVIPPRNSRDGFNRSLQCMVYFLDI